MYGLSKYLRDCGETRLSMRGLYSSCSLVDFKMAVRTQLDKKLPIPVLILNHRNSRLKDYIWHWFWLADYQDLANACLVNTVTYGEQHWLSLDELQDSVYEKKAVSFYLTETVMSTNKVRLHIRNRTLFAHLCMISRWPHTISKS